MSAKGITKTVFLSILQEAKERLLSEKGGIKRISSGEEFEAILFQIIKEICAERKIRDCRRTGKQTFPDIIIWPFGVEAKSTTGDKWISTGNSIVESTRIDDLGEIYIFFFKQGHKGANDIMFKPYEECLSDIIVTHSPRYRINMEMKKGDDIFTKMGTSYNIFRQEDTIKIAKNYYRSILKEGEQLWWIDQDEGEGMTPVIRNYSDLSKKEQDRFKIEVMAYFPEIFSNSNKKYVKPALHLLQQYQATCSSLRDLFSAGGRMTILLRDGSKKTVSKNLYHLRNNAKSIRDILLNTEPDLLSGFWEEKVTTKSAERIWINKLDQMSALQGLKASDVYKAGL